MITKQQLMTKPLKEYMISPIFWYLYNFKHLNTRPVLKFPLEIFAVLPMFGYMTELIFRNKNSTGERVVS